MKFRILLLPPRIYNYISDGSSPVDSHAKHKKLTV